MRSPSPNYIDYDDEEDNQSNTWVSKQQRSAIVRNSEIKFNHAADLDKLKYLSVREDSDEENTALVEKAQEELHVNYQNVLPSNLRSGNFNVMPLMPKNVSRLP